MSAPLSQSLGVDSAVTIWALRLAELAPEAPRYLAWLAPDEHERAARFHAERDRRRFVLARGALRALLGRCLGADPASLCFTYGPQGKPALAPQPGWPDLQFSLAHAGDQALIALTLGRPVGVDLEPLDTTLDALTLGRHVLAPGELAALASAPPVHRPQMLLSFWTGKEALVKAHGCGLSLDPRQIDLVMPVAHRTEDALAPRVVTLPGGQYQLVTVALGPDYVASCALSGAAPQARIRLATQWSQLRCNTATPPSF